MNKDRILVMFDYDGVLVDTLGRNVNAAAEAARQMGHTRLPVKEDVYKLNDMTFQELGRVSGIQSELLDEFAELTLRIIEKIQEPADFFAGAVDFLVRLEKFCTLGIATMNKTSIVNTQLERVSLSDTFKCVIGSETPGHKAAKIAEALDLTGISPEDTFMIGDSRSDISEAHLAGVKSIAVSWGFQPLSILQEEKPTFPAESFSDLFNIIFNYCPGAHIA